MHDLEIKIPRKFLGFSWYRKIKDDYPEKWNELSLKQLIGVVKALHTTTDKHLFRAFAVGAILGIPRWRLQIFSAELMIQLWRLFEDRKSGV